MSENRPKHMMGGCFLYEIDQNMTLLGTLEQKTKDKLQYMGENQGQNMVINSKKSTFLQYLKIVQKTVFFSIVIMAPSRVNPLTGPRPCTWPRRPTAPSAPWAIIAN